MFKLRVLSGTLNIRKEPSVSANIVGQLMLNQEATASDLIPLDGRQWAKIGDGRYLCTYDSKQRYCEVIPLSNSEPEPQPQPSDDVLKAVYNTALDDVHTALVRLRK